MRRQPTNFIEFCLAGRALVDDVYGFIDDWHSSDSQLPLSQYLGMTAEEYALWLEKPESLRFIVHAHEVKEPITSVMQKACEPRMAAPSSDRQSAEEVLHWLQKTKRS